MSAPKIKLYMLPPGFSQAGDTDIQLQRDDELLPCVDRSEQLTDAELLTGVMTYKGLELEPVDMVTGRQSHALGPANEDVQAPAGISYADVVKQPVGYLEPLVATASGVAIVRQVGDVPPPSGVTRWQFADAGVEFLGPAPSGATISCFVKAAIPATTWALPNSLPYAGANTSFNCIRISMDDGDYQAVTPEDVGVSGHKPHVATAAASGVKVDGAFRQAVSRYFIGAHANWIIEHLRMWPDVFVGTVDYPGDDHVEMINGQPVNVSPGALPKYVDPDSYQLNARDGLVIFTSEIDSAATPVKANYAHLANIRNVTSQQLDPVAGASGLRYKADSELAYGDSHGRRWVGRGGSLTPINIYVDGQVTPTVITVAPYDTLEIKSS